MSQNHSADMPGARVPDAHRLTFTSDMALLLFPRDSTIEGHSSFLDQLRTTRPHINTVLAEVLVEVMRMLDLGDVHDSYVVSRRWPGPHATDQLRGACAD